MGRIIVNKHSNNIEDIVNGGLFHKDSEGNFSEFAKGEIVIYNGGEEEPAIYVLGSNGQPQKISGGNNSSIDQEVIDSLKAEIEIGYQSADNEIRDEYANADKQVKQEISQLINSTKVGLIETLEEGDNAVREEIATLNENINETISENTNQLQEVIDSLEAADIKFGEYAIPETFEQEYVISEDSTQVAITKLEKMIYNNAFAISASLNDINMKTVTQSVSVIEKCIDEEHGHEENENVYHLIEGSLNIIETPINNIKIMFSENIVGDNVFVLYDLLFTTGEGVINITLPSECVYATQTLETLEQNTRYLFKFRYNFVEIIKLHTL